MSSNAVASANLYERLGIESTATSEEIRQAYRALLKQYTPERAPEEFKRIREAYEALSDPATRSQYDQSIRDRTGGILGRADAAMQAEDYASAEVMLKQALLEMPDLAIARNLLGLCLLYQGKPQDALAQFQRLLRDPNAAATVWANAGHAYRLVKQPAEASSAFREAIARAGADAGDYYVALADLWIGENDFTKASAVLEKGIRADGKVDFDDVALLLKLLEVRLFQHNNDGIRAALQSLIGVAQQEDQRRFIAWKLGILCTQLIRYEAFARAREVAAVAERLQPDDVDYSALRDVATALETHKHDSALRLLKSHVSFAPHGWLQGLSPVVRAYCQAKAAYNGMQPIGSPPTMRTLNTVGAKLYGRRAYDAATNSYVATLYFVVLFLPIIPLACYRVISEGAGWRFLGKVPFSRTEKRHLIGVAVAAFVLLAMAALSSNTSATDTASSGTYTGPVAAASLTPAEPTGIGASPEQQSFASRPVTYNGTVTNAGLPNTPASLIVSLDSTRDTTTGFVNIGAPLGGTGAAFIVMKPDSIYIVSGSTAGDTILWAARRKAGAITGRYILVGGPMKGQRGTWQVQQPIASTFSR